MCIPLFPGLIYTTDGSQEKGNMGESFYRHEDEMEGFCKVGRDEKGSSFNRVEHAAACIVFEDAIRYAGSQRPLILFKDSKCHSSYSEGDHCPLRLSGLPAAHTFF